MNVRRYRLRMSPLMRVVRTAVLGAIAVFFVPSLLAPGVDLGWRLIAVAGILSSGYGLRVVLGPALEVRPGGLRLLNRWPWRRDIPWYRILEVEVVPGAWTLDLELNSGEQIALPCVERVDDLYEAVETRRHLLDAGA